jgi:Tfp pilus assembly protein PilV
MKLTNDDIIALLDLEIYEAMGYDSDVLSSNRKHALDYYHGRMQATPNGRSEIVSHDVADTVHALMCQSADLFKSSLIEFEPDNEDDEIQAQMESDVIRSIVNKNDAYATYNKCSFNAYLQGNGWIKIWLEEDETTEREEYKNPDAPEVIKILTPKNNNETIEVIEGDTDEDFIVLRTTTIKTLRQEAVSTDVMLYSTAQNQYELQELRFVAERKLMTTADLMEAGLTKQQAMEVPDISDDYWEAIQAREGEYSETTDDEDGGNQEASKLKETFECYFLIDLNGSGKLERRKLHKAGSHLIINESATHVPYVTGSPLPMPHRIQGQGMYDIMKQIQDSKTFILRSYMDNLTVMNASRVGYIKGEVNMDELLNGRINGAVGMDRENSLFPIPSNDIGMSAIQGLTYLDQVRTARGGASVELNKAEMQIAKSSAAAATGQEENKEKMAGYYCKNLANTLLKNSYLLIHKILREQYKQPIDAKVSGKWIETNPSDWQARSHAKLTAGLTTSEKSKRVNGLNELMAQQQAWLQAGMEGIITDKRKIYNASCDWLRSADISQNPEEYLTDPDSEEAQQVMQQQAEQQQQQAQAMEQQQQMMLMMQQQLEKMKDDTERWKTTVDNQLEYYKTNVTADIDEAKITAENSIKLMQATPAQ